MKSQKEFIKQFREIINPTAVKEGETIPNLMKLFTKLPPTPMQSVQPTQQAQPQPEPTMENVRASMNEPEGKLSKNYPYGAK
jgi:hypothetical protein